MAFPNLSWRLNKAYWQAVIRRLQKSRQPFILEVEFGGLGDHLIFSGLPEFFQKKFNISFLISLRSPFCHPEIKDMVWGDNPYVEFTGQPGRILGCPRVEGYTTYNDAYSIIFDMPEDWPNIRIYYQPKKITVNENEILCELTFGKSGEHNGYTDRIFADKVVSYLQENFRDKTLVLLKPPAEYANTSIMEAVIRSDLKFRIQGVENIYHLADLLFSYPVRILLYSGPASLCAAINCQAIVLCNKLASPYFQYKTNKYVLLMDKPVT